MMVGENGTLQVAFLLPPCVEGVRSAWKAVGQQPPRMRRCVQATEVIHPDVSRTGRNFLVTVYN